MILDIDSILRAIVTTDVRDHERIQQLLNELQEAIDRSRREPKDVKISTKKPFANYLCYALGLFYSGEFSVVLKARGEAIARAINIVNVLRQQFMKNLILNSVKFTTEVFEDNGSERRVSAAEIRLTNLPVFNPRDIDLFRGDTLFNEAIAKITHHLLGKRTRQLINMKPKMETSVFAETSEISHNCPNALDGH